MPKIPEDNRDSIEVLLDTLKALEHPADSRSQVGKEPSLQHLKELRKMLAELQLELRKVSKIKAWDRSKLLNCALLQAKLKRLELADVFVDLEDIKRLAEIRSDVEEWLSLARQEGEIKDNPLSGMLQEARGLHSAIEKIRQYYEHMLELLADLGGSEWSNEHIQRQKEENHSHWEKFLVKLEAERELMEENFPHSKNGPEPGLYALNQLMDPESLWREDDFRNILALTKREGVLWEKVIKQFEGYQTRIQTLERQYQEDEKRMLEAHLLAQKGDYQQAGKLLEQTSRSFIDLPYESVQDEVFRWKELAIQPFQELAELFPTSANLTLSRDAILSFGAQFPLLVKDHVSDRLRGSFNPLGLFLSCRKWEKQVLNFIEKCNKALEKVEGEQRSDFKEIITERWRSAEENARLLLDEIRKRAMGYFIRKIVVVSLLVASTYLGYQLFSFWHELPETGIRFKDTSAFLHSAQIINDEGTVLKGWTGKDTAYGELLRLPPDSYNLHVEFKDTFPIKIKVDVHLGRVTDLSDRLKLEYSASLGRVLDFRIPSGSEITLSNNRINQVKKYKVEAETLPFGINSCLSLDWDASSNLMAIAERNGRLLLVSTEDDVATLGTLYVQGESFDKVLLSRHPSKKYVAGISMSGVVYVWEAVSGKVLGNLSHEGKSVIATAFYDNSSAVLTLDSDFQLRLWELNAVRELKNSPLVIDTSTEAKNWTLKKIHPTWHLNLPRGLKHSLEKKVQTAEILIPENSQKITVGILHTNGNVQLWTGEDLENLRYIDLEASPLQSIAFHPSGRSMVAINRAGDLVQFQWSGVTEVIKSTIMPKLHHQDIIQIMFDPTGNVLLIVSIKGKVEVVSLEDVKETKQLPFKVTPQAVLVSSPNAESIAFYSAKEEIQIWEKWITQRVFAPTGDYQLAIHSPDGESLLQKRVNVNRGGFYRFNLQSNGRIKNVALADQAKEGVNKNTGKISETGGAATFSEYETFKNGAKTSGASPTGE